MILHAGKEELQGAVARPLTRLSWTARSEEEGGRRSVVSRLASFVENLRAQLVVLTEGKSVAGLREGLGGETLLASVRVAAHPRLVPVPLVLAGGRESKPGHVQRGQLLALRQELESLSDEGGIYSW